MVLDGGLIETSGAMSGGGSQPSRGTMNSKFASTSISPQVLQTYERDSEHAAQQLQTAISDLREAEAVLDQLNGRTPRSIWHHRRLLWKLKISENELWKRTGRSRAEVFSNITLLMPFASSQNKPNAGDLACISKLETEIAASQNDLNKLQEKSKRIEQDIKDLENKFLEIGGSKLPTQKSKVNGIRVRIDIANDKITKAEVAKNKAEKEARKLQGTLATNATTSEELNSEMQQLYERLGELANEVAQLREKVEAAQAAAENSKEDLENLKTELDEKEEEISGFRQREVCFFLS